MMSLGRLRTALLATSLLLATGVVLAPSASAHDELVGSTPANGASVPRLPANVELDFEEPPVDGYTKVRVIAPDGMTVSRPPISNGSKVVVPLRASSAHGTFRIAYSILSDDGHPVSGVVSFRVPADAAAVLATASAGATGHHRSSSTVLGFVAVATLVLIASAFVGTRRARRRDSRPTEFESAGARAFSRCAK